MTSGNTTGRMLLREALLALLVLSLVFLSFGHPAAAREGYGVASDDTSWCGDPIAPTDLSHTPCHACRIGEGAALPPMPVEAEAVCFAQAAVVYAEPALALDVFAPPTFANPRAPPAA